MWDWANGFSDAIPLEYAAFCWMASFPAYTLRDFWELDTDAVFTVYELIHVEAVTGKPLRYT